MDVSEFHLFNKKVSDKEEIRNNIQKLLGSKVKSPFDYTNDYDQFTKENETAITYDIQINSIEHNESDSGLILRPEREGEGPDDSNSASESSVEPSDNEEEIIKTMPKPMKSKYCII